ncbi:synaptogenesis protein syg-2-like isoform X2 [Macrobrachium nipponense]|uniref:synaptogenesis protein syg-2-like isoform X2 n=1 Tax=Macrobrachium nipponense TaxID=159736 RepID=UPI0030C7AA6B
MNTQVRKRRKAGEVGMMNLLLLICLYSASQFSGASAEFNETVIKAVLSKEVHIPCKAYAPTAENSVRLILWYKDHNTRPMYSFDARTPMGRHWIEEESLGDRAQFISDVEEPYLRLQSVQYKDEGVYTCRVDYRLTPTVRTKTKLKVIIPPGRLAIIDENGVEADQKIGPYDEGTTIKVTCLVFEGKPAPQVKWWRKSRLLDDTVEYANASVFQNILEYGPLGRDHQGAYLVCQATNTDKVSPQAKGVTLDINFKPSTVEILGTREPMTAEKEHTVECQSIGARPAADITWWLDDIDLTNQSVTAKDKEGNVSSSIMTITPREEDAGKLLTCKAQSPVINHEPLNDTWKLEIYYAPKVTLALDAELDPNDIKEGDNVTFICNVTANPKVDKVSWYHKGTAIHHNATAGVKIRNHKLILKMVEREQAGVYTCVANNGIGDGTSQPIFLNIKYVPVCSDERDAVVGVAKGTDVQLQCIVDASPGDVSFKWYFRSPKELLPIDEERYTVQDRTSKLTYHVRTEHDYGEFLCYAENELGEQALPCQFDLVPAGKPDSLENCTVTNQTSDTIFIACLPGFNGGLDQHFVVVVQAYDDKVRGEILRNATEKEQPVFVIEGLQPGASYLLAIYAENVKGRSDDSILHGFTLPLAPGERTLPSTHIFPITPILGVLIGVVGALVIVAVVVVVVMKLRSDARAKESPKGRSESNLKGPHAPLQPAKDGDDGPDVILYPSYEEVDGIPSKLKHANIYETVQCDSKENGKNSEADDVEYAELTFTNGKNKTKNKKSGVNGTIRTSEENTIYASIDHTRTALQNTKQQQQQPKQQQQQPKQQPKQQQQQQDHNQQLLKGKQAIDHLDTAAQGENEHIPLMDTALESSV